MSICRDGEGGYGEPCAQILQSVTILTTTHPLNLGCFLQKICLCHSVP